MTAETCFPRHATLQGRPTTWGIPKRFQIDNFWKKIDEDFSARRSRENDLDLSSRSDWMISRWWDCPNLVCRHHDRGWRRWYASSFAEESKGRSGAPSRIPKSTSGHLRLRSPKCLGVGPGMDEGRPRLPVCESGLVVAWKFWTLASSFPELSRGGSRLPGQFLNWPLDICVFVRQGVQGSI